jgi:putative ABC transport system substrate-binding protein
MRRREFIGLVAGTAVLQLHGAHAQNSVKVRVGFLHVGAAASFGQIVAAFREGLMEMGYVDHQNVEIEFRWAEGHYDRLPALAGELVSHQVSVIVTGGGEMSAIAAKAATSTIPIVFNTGRDPVKAGLVASLNRPGGNMTGVNILTDEMAAKRIGLLHDVMPNVSVVAYLANPNFQPSQGETAQVDAAAHRLGIRIVHLKASSPGDIEAAFASMREKQVGALLVGADPFFNSRRDQFAALTARNSIPSLFEQREFAVAGCLMSYGTSLTDSYRQMGKYAGRILKGEKPADLPIVQSAKFELVINLKTAKSLGLTIPTGILSISDEVIE